MTDDSNVILWLRENVKYFAEMQDVAEKLACQKREQEARYADCPRARAA